IANRTSNPTNATQLPLDLNPDTDYTIVTRYDTRTGVSTLWVNPASESDGGIAATDAASTLPVSTYAFRQSDSFGQMNIDDLKVATTFGEVLGHPVLSVERTAGGLAISWEAAAGASFRLQGSPALGGAADWQDEPAVPQLEHGRLVARPAAPSGIRFYRLIRNPLAGR
ncbi:MAG TPA: hypothetical protein VNO52_02675, partial [Methylomirabilota bacterium]|nr:hypothetical protein [Methylomirabilota bacterium]